MDENQKRIEEMEKEIRETPYHKGTEHYIGKLRARIARLKDQIYESGGKGGGGAGFAVKKHGDATVVLVGFPSVGKSTLLNQLTNANSPTAEYAFTTVTVIPGMMDYKGARIQILDVPGLIEGGAAGRGRGREVLSVVRSADLLLIISQVGRENDFNKIKAELHANGVRVNQLKPNLRIVKRLKGGIDIRSTVKQDLDVKTIEGIFKEFRIGSAEVYLGKKATVDDLIDVLSSSRVYVRALDVLNKVDKNDGSNLEKTSSERFPIKISAEKGKGLENLKEKIWESLGMVRVYLRENSKKSDERPLIMHTDNTLLDVARKVGNEFAEDIDEAKIWGPGARFPEQTVSLSTKVQDGMEVMFI